MKKIIFLLFFFSAISYSQNFTSNYYHVRGTPVESKSYVSVTDSIITIKRSTSSSEVFTILDKKNINGNENEMLYKCKYESTDFNIIVSPSEDDYGYIKCTHIIRVFSMDDNKPFAIWFYSTKDKKED